VDIPLSRDIPRSIRCLDHAVWSAYAVGQWARTGVTTSHFRSFILIKQVNSAIRYRAALCQRDRDKQLPNGGSIRNGPFCVQVWRWAVGNNIGKHRKVIESRRLG
jgi:hypothetical protein